MTQLGLADFGNLWGLKVLIGIVGYFGKLGFGMLTFGNSSARLLAAVRFRLVCKGSFGNIPCLNDAAFLVYISSLLRIYDLPRNYLRIMGSYFMRV